MSINKKVLEKYYSTIPEKGVIGVEGINNILYFLNRNIERLNKKPEPPSLVKSKKNPFLSWVYEYEISDQGRLSRAYGSFLTDCVYKDLKKTLSKGTETLSKAEFLKLHKGIIEEFEIKLVENLFAENVDKKLNIPPEGENVIKTLRKYADVIQITSKEEFKKLGLASSASSILDASNELFAIEHAREKNTSHLIFREILKGHFNNHSFRANSYKENQLYTIKSRNNKEVKTALDDYLGFKFASLDQKSGPQHHKDFKKLNMFINKISAYYKMSCPPAKVAETNPRSQTNPTRVINNFFDSINDMSPKEISPENLERIFMKHLRDNLSPQEYKQVAGKFSKKLKGSFKDMITEEWKSEHPNYDLTNFH